jgi:hypothetical protein
MLNGKARAVLLIRDYVGHAAMCPNIVESGASGRRLSVIVHQILVAK